MENKRRVQPIDEYVGNLDLKCIRRIKRDLYSLEDTMLVLEINFKQVVKVVPTKEMFKYKNETYIKDKYLRLLIIEYGNNEYNDYRFNIIDRDIEYHMNGYIVDGFVSEKITINEFENDFIDYDRQMIEDPDDFDILPSLKDDDIANIIKHIYED